MNQYVKCFKPFSHNTYEVSNLAEYKTKTNGFKTSIKVFHVNICSIEKNLDELLAFINTLNDSFDVIVLTETFVIHDKDIFSIPNYDFYYNDSRINRNDGTVVLVKSDLEYNIKYCDIGPIKCIEVKLTLDQSNFFMQIYRNCILILIYKLCKCV